MNAVHRVIRGRTRDLGGLNVVRLLPAPGRKTIGPFIFFDHMASVFESGQGVDVRPHPHIGLATVTYLFEGELLHRDSLGTEQLIRPGDVNWMVAGRGIVHSERTPPSLRADPQGSRLLGIQTWVALPTVAEETEPSFVHYPARELPERGDEGKHVRLIAGEAWGMRSPVAVNSPTLFAAASMIDGADLGLPDSYAERAIYVAQGGVEVSGDYHPAGDLVEFNPGEAGFQSVDDSRVIILGGAPLDGPRYIWWNLVSSSQARIERAKLEWREERFAPVPGETERIPLPED